MDKKTLEFIQKYLVYIIIIIVTLIIGLLLGFALSYNTAKIYFNELFEDFQDNYSCYPKSEENPYLPDIFKAKRQKIMRYVNYEKAFIF